jgi:hypothetical protein
MCAGTKACATTIRRLSQQSIGLEQIFQVETQLPVGA